MTQNAHVSCDAIILTALPVECKAVLHHLQNQEEIVHTSGTIYFIGSFAGIYRVWRVAVAEIGMGGIPAVLEAEKAMSFFHAKVALFVGIAGGIKDVQIGDVVAATKIYAYESGKAGGRFEPRPDLGHSSHALEQRARAEGRSEKWLTRLSGDRPEPAPQVYVGALAAGEKVLGSTQSDLAKLLRETYGDTLAIEMEGHGFLHAVRVNQQVYGLVIRGISDLIDDKAEADASGAQVRAARYAAAFAFQVLAKFTLPERDDAVTHPAIWNVPFVRNPFFSGREDLLQRLADALQADKATALAQPQAISGLGGIGKTQIALEYAYQHAQEYQFVLWTLADTRESLVSGYIAIAKALDLPHKSEQDQTVIIEVVKRWLQGHSSWLLILDNADELTPVREFIPTLFGGHILLTTRAQSMGRLAKRIEVDTMSQDIGALFLLRRAGRVAENALLDAVSSSDVTIAYEICKELGGLPLALDQAGAYIEEIPCSLTDYLSLYRTHRAEMLNTRGGLVDDYRESVATTWSISFKNVEEKNPAAADLLRLCAFLSPDAIREEMIIQGAKYLGSHVLEAAADPLLWNRVVGTLGAYSLARRNTSEKTLGVHRLVQAVLQDMMSDETRHLWAKRAVLVVNNMFPEVKFTTWPQCERYLSHALVCVKYVKQEQISDEEAVGLLHNTGTYLIERGRVSEAQPLLEQALAMREQYLGPKHIVMGDTIDRLARCFEMQEMYREAESLYTRALSIREQQLGSDHFNTATSLNNLALLYRKQRKDEEAESLYRRALTISEKQLGGNHPLTASYLNNLGALYYQQGKDEEAESLYKRALAISEERLGGDDPLTSVSLSNLASLYDMQKKYSEAEPLFRRVLAIRERQLGDDHLDTARSLDHLARIYRAQEKYAKAEPLYTRALAIRERQLGDNHPDTATSLNNLASLYESQGRFLEAEPLYWHALEINEKAYGLEHPQLMLDRHNLILFYEVRGKYSQAELLYRQALEVCKRQFGNDSLFTASSLNKLATCYYNQGKYSEAESMFQQALSICERVLGADHPDTQRIRGNYADLQNRLSGDISS